ncbi:hypothetical protein BU23DRAFT_570097 [Bimuria novae-zelandiae CBS 107.79]|uniref:Uncharacterized protein n=1 Tax=Bimuria novae-zelandiae CBS 107.79 TaxID=1447943 RepID=A0A6A5V8H5_9PLEO|nr:hypothetical protein BU23DRAFT_570097 [Bimuria novae-zelandiae CBS 107.79]
MAAKETARPLPKLPSEDRSDESLDLGSDEKTRDDRKGNEGGQRSILKGSDDFLALFDDTSEVHVETSSDLNNDLYHSKAHQHVTTLFSDSAVPPPPPQHRSIDAFTYRLPTDPNPTAESIHPRAIYIAHYEQDADPWSPANEIEIGSAISLRRVSTDAVINFGEDTARLYQSTTEPAGTYYDSPTDEDDEAYHTPLVHFVDTHTYLRTPSPPTPPPHRSNVSSTSLPLSPSPTPSTFESYPLKPYGPRIPPWGSAENLDRERQLRTDIRVLDDKLQERFDGDAIRRARERQRAAEELRMGIRRTEGEELRELVLAVYPEMEAERRERGWCCACVVM